MLYTDCLFHSTVSMTEPNSKEPHSDTASVASSASSSSHGLSVEKKPPCNAASCSEATGSGGTGERSVLSCGGASAPFSLLAQFDVLRFKNGFLEVYN